MNRDAIRETVEALLKQLMEVPQVLGCSVDDDRGDVLAALGRPDSPDSVPMALPLAFGGRLLIWYSDRPAIGVVRTRARTIERRLAELVLAHERSLVRPPRKPGAA